MNTYGDALSAACPCTYGNTRGGGLRLWAPECAASSLNHGPAKLCFLDTRLWPWTLQQLMVSQLALTR